MNCPECGSPLPKGYEVCPACTAPASPSNLKAAEAMHAPAEGDLKQQIEQARSTSRKKRKVIPIIVLALALSLLLGADIACGGWVYTHVVQPVSQALFGQSEEDGRYAFAESADVALAVKPAQAAEAAAAPSLSALSEMHPSAAEAAFSSQLETVRAIVNGSIYSTVKGGAQNSGNTVIVPATDESLANLLSVARGEYTYMAGIGSWNFTTGRIVYTYVDLGNDGQLDLVVAHESQEEEWSSEALDFVKVTRYNPLLAYAAKADGTLSSVLQGMGSVNSVWTITKDGCFAVSGISGGRYEVHAYTVKQGEAAHVVSYQYNFWDGTCWRDYTYDPADESTWDNAANTHEAITEAQYEELQNQYGSASRVNESLSWQPLLEEEAAQEASAVQGEAACEEAVLSEEAPTPAEAADAGDAGFDDGFAVDIPDEADSSNE